MTHPTLRLAARIPFVHRRDRSFGRLVSPAVVVAVFDRVGAHAEARPPVEQRVHVDLAPVREDARGEDHRERLMKRTELRR